MSTIPQIPAETADFILNLLRTALDRLDEADDAIQLHTPFRFGDLHRAHEALVDVAESIRLARGPR